MIKWVSIRNFKSLQNVRVDLAPFTVLIGQNGAGKSSFLQAIELLSWLVRYNSINEVLERERLSYNELVSLRAASSMVEWTLGLAVPDPDAPEQSVDVGAMFALAKRRHVYVHREFVFPPEVHDQDLSYLFDNARFVIGRIGRTVVARESGKKIAYSNVKLPHSVLLDVRRDPKAFPVLSRVADALASFIHYEIWGPERLREPSAAGDLVLAGRGQNLPSVLHSLRSKSPSMFDELVRQVQAAYPWLEAIEMRQLGERNYALAFLEKPGDKRSRRLRYQPSQVSDGFLRLLALTTLKYQPGTVSILGYEEPENGMHPAMLAESVRRLRDIGRAGTQVIVTTHSPILLQELLSEEHGGDPVKELRLVRRGRDGRTTITPPDPATIEKARSHGVGIGELWSMFLGEDELVPKP